MIYIYCLKDNDNIYYVGQTSDLAKRKYQHIRQSFEMSDMKDTIIQKQLKLSHDIVLHVLEECRDEFATETEILWIKKLSGNGNILSNRVHIEPFTPSELNILNLIANGYSSKEIADMPQLKRSVKTIEVHRYNMLIKANAKSSAQLVYWAMKNGIIS